MNYISPIIKTKIHEAKERQELELDLSYSELNNIPTEVFDLKSLEILRLRNNNLKGIPKDILKLKNLKLLDLTDNKLDRNFKSISKLPKLQYLGFNWNTNKKVFLLRNNSKFHLNGILNLFKSILNKNNNIFHWLKNLKELEITLAVSLYEDIPMGLSDFKNLTILNLHWNNLEPEILSKFLENFTQLIHLNLTCYALKDLPVSIGNLSNLTHLNLRSYNLKILPDSLGSLSNLTHLNLELNQLEDLPKFIGNFSNLTHLNLKCSNLNTLPDSLGNLSNLTHLNLRSSNLTILPNFIGNLSNLTHLNLELNQLEDLPDFIGNLSNLTHLNLECSNIKTLPESIGNLSNLTHLYLQKNQLKELPASIGNLSNLTHLYLQKNQLKELPASIGKLSNLTHLCLNLREFYDVFSENQFSQFPKVIGYLQNLTTLDQISIPEKYHGISLAELPAKSLLTEKNAEMRRLLIQLIGYDRICSELGAVELDNWREYTLLKIEQKIDIEPIHLLKMTCPSTRYIHVLRVPPEATSARVAIKWVNWGVDPEEFDIET